MRVSLFVLTAVLALVGVVLIAASFRRHDHDAAQAALMGMTAMICAAVPALAYTGFTG